MKTANCIGLLNLLENMKMSSCVDLSYTDKLRIPDNMSLIQYDTLKQYQC